MIKVRFTTDGRDYRPVVFPPEHPWWCTGYKSSGRAIIISYADNVEQISDYWPDYEDLETTHEYVEGYQFSSRMPKPEWFNV